MGTAGRHLLCLDTAMGESFFTVVSLHINKTYAKKRAIASDFNGTAWRRQSDSDLRPSSIIEEAFANTNLLLPPVSTPL